MSPTFTLTSTVFGATPCLYRVLQFILLTCILASPYPTCTLHNRNAKKVIITQEFQIDVLDGQIVLSLLDMPCGVVNFEYDLRVVSQRFRGIHHTHRLLLELFVPPLPFLSLTVKEEVQPWRVFEIVTTHLPAKVAYLFHLFLQQVKAETALFVPGHLRIRLADTFALPCKAHLPMELALLANKKLRRSHVRRSC